MFKSDPVRLAEGFDGDEDGLRRFFQSLLNTATFGAARPELAGALPQGEIRLAQHKGRAPGDEREDEEMLKPDRHVMTVP